MESYYVSDYSSNNVGKPYFQSPTARFDAEPTDGSFIPPQGPLRGPPYNQPHVQSEGPIVPPVAPRPHESFANTSSGLIPNHEGIYNASPFDIDYREFIKRLLKYVIEGLAIGIVAFLVFRSKLTWKEAGMIGLTAGFAYCILDTFSPSVSFGARFGTGFGLGQAMIPH